jgi:tetratricopeptide (TPR) repeat protein
MKTLIKLSIVIVALNVISCGNHPEVSMKDQYLQRIDSLENKLRETKGVDNMAANDLIAVYSTYAENFPQDSLVPDYLFKAGELANSVKQGTRAINIFNLLYEKYPTYKKAHYCLFLQGFIYETQLNNLEKAKEFYTKVIEKYPNEPIANDAKACIQNLGKSDEELIKEFEEKNKKES